MTEMEKVELKNLIEYALDYYESDDDDELYQGIEKNKDRIYKLLDRL